MTELGLAPLPPTTALAVRSVNRSLAVLNRRFMVPPHHLGLGPWIATPFGGYILLLRVRGRRSGVPGRGCRTAWLWRQGVVALGILAVVRRLAGLRWRRPRAVQTRG